MVELIDGLLITEYHPAKINNEWIFPCDYKDSKLIQCDYVYNIILKNRSSILINGIECVTLGHGLKGPIIEHPFLGTERVINDFKNFNS